MHYANGKKRVLDLNELPLVPPMVHDYKPSKEGLSVLSKVHYWVEVVDPKTNMKAIRETNTMPQWSGSCWYFLRFCDPHNEQEAWSKKKEAYWMPVDLYIGGAEHAVLHLLYSRFWHKVLFDIGYVSHPEPFIKLRNQGLIISKAYKMEGGGYVPKSEVKQDGEMLRHIKTGERVTASIEKMSKSKRNGISPGEIIKEFGADSLRLYALFLGPFDQEKVWQTYAISGCKRFLHRVFALVCSKKACNIYVHEADVLLHVLIHGVEEDLKAFRFNTAIAKMMEFVNSFSRLSQYPRNCIRILIQIIYLFAPHFGEECWEILGEKSNLSCLPFPQFDERFLQKEKVVIVFQVNGKVRGSASFTKGASQQQVEIVAQNDCNVKKFLCGPIQKVVFLPNKLLNIVV